MVDTITSTSPHRSTVDDALEAIRAVVGRQNEEIEKLKQKKTDVQPEHNDSSAGPLTTLIDCIRADKQEMDQIQHDLNMLARHEFSSPVKIFYGGRFFEIVLLKKEKC